MNTDRVEAEAEQVQDGTEKVVADQVERFAVKDNLQVNCNDSVVPVLNE